MWESMSPPFFSEACLEKDRLSFFIRAAQFVPIAIGIGSHLFLVKPVLKKTGFLFYTNSTADLKPFMGNEGVFYFSENLLNYDRSDKSVSGASSTGVSF